MINVAMHQQHVAQQSENDVTIVMEMNTSRFCRSKNRLSAPEKYNRCLNEVTLQLDSESSEEEY